MKNRSIAIYLSIIGFLLLLVAGWYSYSFLSQPEEEPITVTPTKTEVILPTGTPAPKIGQTPFDGFRTYADVETQVAFGPRSPETEGHAQLVEWMRSEIEATGWQVEVQESEAMGHPVKNIIARNSDEPPQIIIGAHYDSRIFADHDPDPAKQTQPVPAANDGASGVAVLLGLARSLPKDAVPVWLVFFDAEDNGRIDTWDWILGSREFVKNNPDIQPQAVVVIDMIGDADLNIYKERNSNAAITDEIWGVAQTLGYQDKFIPDYKFSMLDDHTPFLEAGIPAVDLIDFDYPYWHTTGDTPDKVSAESLQVVGDTLYTWIVQKSEK
ncbi:MAG: M28 family peptidase [Anaerolineales bacterium]